MNREAPGPNIIVAFIGLLLTPQEMVKSLFSKRPGPHAFVLLFITASTLLVPPIAQILKYRYVPLASPQMLAIIISMLAGFCTFLCLEFILVALLRIQVSPLDLFVGLSYALTPLNLALWLVYGFNYASQGRLTIVTYFLTGYGGRIADNFVHVMPGASAICVLWIAIVLFYALREVCEESPVSVAMVTIVSAVPLLIAVAVALFLGEAVHSGYIHTWGRVLGLA